MALTIDTINISPVFTKCSIYLCEKCEAYEDNKGRGVNVSPVPRKTPEKYGKRRNVEEMENGDTKGGAAKTMKYTLARSNSVCSSDASSQEATYNHKPVSYTHLRAHETPEHLVCRLLLE